MLNVLDLSGNSLHGKIPSSMSEIKNPGIINLSDNRSSRKIYRHWKGFELLDTLDLSSIEDQSIWWHPKFHVLTTLASSYEIEQQQFLGNFCGLCKTAQGEISEELTNLSCLVTLNLSWNRLTGKISAMIGDLKLLEILDLSINHLSGPIPSNQFGTFTDPSIYEGNPELCGPPLLSNCSKPVDEGNKAKNDKRKNDEDKGILEEGDIKNKGEGISFSLCVSVFSAFICRMLSALISSLNLELIIYMFLDQGFELMKNSKIRYLNLLSVNIEVKIFRRRTSELSCWNLNSSWAWGFVEL
ncbi:hypothetical protein D5086_016079 [Populus alba]|uniref:Uncharacterized protein n=1 Tax=Populus alba TaxID=43335 RepID=A0ACC4BTL0_POPAL